MGKTFGRKLVDISQKARGRHPLKYEFEIIPYFARDIPAGIESVSFAWERGSKLYVTDAQPVNPNTQAVFWKQYLKQTATLYKEGSTLHAKDYAFKIQSVTKDSKGHEERKTIGKTHVDLSEYCTGEVDPEPQELMLQLKPVGKLKLSIKATWLKDAKIDPDAMTEVTQTQSEWTSTKDPYEDQYDEQDLSGFEHNSRADSQSSKPRRSSRRKKQPQQDEGVEEEPAAEATYDEEGQEVPKPRKHKKKHRHKHRNGDYPEDDPNGLEQVQEDEEYHGQKQTEDEFNSLVAQAMSQGLSSAQRIEKKTWRDYLCCCLPRRHIPVAYQEDESLLTKSQHLELQNRNRL